MAQKLRLVEQKTEGYVEGGGYFAAGLKLRKKKISSYLSQVISHSFSCVAVIMFLSFKVTGGRIVRVLLFKKKTNKQNNRIRTCGQSLTSLTEACLLTITCIFQFSFTGKDLSIV